MAQIILGHDVRLDWDARVRGCVHCTVGTFARGRVYDLVATHVRIAHKLNFMDDWVIWPNYTDGHMQLKAKAMQLKVEAMQLKVDMQSNIGGGGSTKS